MKWALIIVTLMSITLTVSACKTTNQANNTVITQPDILGAKESGDLPDCDSTGDDSDCPDGQICVGVGVCVPVDKEELMSRTVNDGIN